MFSESVDMLIIKTGLFTNGKCEKRSEQESDHIKVKNTKLKSVATLR